MIDVPGTLWNLESARENRTPKSRRLNAKTHEERNKRGPISTAGGTHDGDHGQMPKDLEGDASCRVPGPTEMTKTLDEDLDLISQVFDGKLVKLCQIRSHTKIWESRKRIWWQQLQDPPEALLTAQRQGVALEVAHHDLHQLHKHNDLRQGLDRGPRRSQGVVVYSHRSAVQLFSHTSGPFFSREQLPIQRASLVENLAAAGSSRVRRACGTNGIFGMMVMFDIDICCPLGDVSALGDQAVL